MKTLMKSRFGIYFCSVLLALGMLLTVLAGTASADITGTLSPNSVAGTHDYNETWIYTLDYCIEITGEATGKADVLFLTDTTGSMGGYIAGIRTAFSGILAAIDACLPALDIEYGVSDYRNYTDAGNYSTYGVKLRQPFTSDTTAVQTAINGLSADGGADTPESQLKAMVTLSDNWLTVSDPNVGFSGRADAQKILIWAGDVPGHIAGDEPNSSGSPPAGYYPSLDAAINALNAQGILVFALNTRSCGNGIDVLYGGVYVAHEPLRQQASEITSATGGTLFCSVGTGGSSIEDAIIAAITGGVETLSNITLSLDGDDGDFVVDPCTQTIIGSWTADDSPVCGSFDFDATAPGYDGVADFDMVLLGNGAELDRTDVHLTTIEPIEVAVDIKPGSCPNPLNIRSKGMLPVAVLGSEELDVTTIDVASIRLADVAPIRSNYEDVAAPVIDGDECECTTEGPDGYLDLTLKFKTKAIVAALGEVVNGETLVLTLTGELSDETPIEGEDCIRVKKRRAKKPKK